jgi:uncharacterized protein
LIFANPFKNNAMSIETNRALVTKFYHLMSQLQFEPMFELMADDATWTVAGNPHTFHHAGVATKAQRIVALSNFTQVFASLQMHIVSTTAEADRVAAQLITRCTTLSGINYENELLVLIRIHNGKIASLYEQLDQATALEFERKLQTAVPAGH